jgi:hypothetical protein
MQYAGPAVRPSVTLPHAGRQPRLWPVVGSLLLLSFSYLLLTAAPAVSQQLRALAGQGQSSVLGTWALALAATGLLLGGIAALVLVLVQLADDARRRPYVYLSPVLATFSACILMGLGAKLPLASVSAEHLAVFALVVAVVGGALIQDARPALQRTGLVLTLWPSVSLLLMVWVATGGGDPAVGLWTLGPAALGYLVILTVSSFAIAATSLVVRSVEAAAPVVAQRSAADVIRVHELAGHAARASNRLSALWQRDLPRLHKPLLALCGIVLAVGVVRAIVGASSGRDEALAPALMEPVQGPTVSPWVAPVTAQTPAHPAARAPAPSNSKVGGERMLTSATGPAVSHEVPRVRRERAPRRVRTRSLKAQPAPAPAPVVRALGEDDWNVPITAPKRALTPVQESKPAPQPIMRAPAEPPPSPEPKPAAKPAAASTDPTLDALMTDVLSTVK